MEALIVRLECSVEAAHVLESLIGGCVQATQLKLNGIPAEHTRRKLEAILENAHELTTAVAMAIANPIEVEIDEATGEVIEQPPAEEA